MADVVQLPAAKKPTPATKKDTATADDRQAALVRELATLVADAGKVIRRLSTQKLTKERANLIRTQISPNLREMSIALLRDVKVQS